MFSAYDERGDRDRDEEANRRETTSFVFPVYHKLGAGAPRAIPDRNLAEVVVVKSGGILVESIDRELVKVNDAFSAVAAASFDSSTTILPVAGDVFPNG